MPLWKKRNSENAMGYRPIALLQAGYKVVAKVLSHRVQKSRRGYYLGHSTRFYA